MSAGSGTASGAVAIGPRLIALTGGPGAGKTAVLEVLQRQACRHVATLPESASILWRGGFPRVHREDARRCAQRAITRVQFELERMAIESGHYSLVLCDRGTLDGLAYWPGEQDDYFRDLGTTRATELARYAAVIHLRVPTEAQGYDHRNTMRTETVDEALAVDDRIAAAWQGHPHLVTIASEANFLTKLERVLTVVAAWQPSCCHTPGAPRPVAS